MKKLLLITLISAGLIQLSVHSANTMLPGSPASKLPTSATGIIQVQEAPKKERDPQLEVKQEQVFENYRSMKTEQIKKKVSALEGWLEKVDAISRLNQNQISAEERVEVGERIFELAAAKLVLMERVL